jgi:hypothetical protein
MSEPFSKPAIPEHQLDPMELMLMRIARLERRLEHYERTIPQQVMQALGMFFAAAGANRNEPTTFDFDFYTPGTDTIGDTLRLVASEAGLNFFAYAGPDQWVEVTWVQPNSLLWNKAAAFLKEHQLLDAHVKLVALTANPEPQAHVEH